MLTAAFGSHVSLRTRFVLYMFGPLAVVAGITLESMRRLPKKPFDLGFIMQAMVALTVVFMLINAVKFTNNSGVNLYFSGEDDTYRDDYLEHELGWHYVTMQDINQQLPEDTTVRFMWEPRYLYCDNERMNCYTDSLMDAWYYARRTVDDGSPAAIAEQWKADGADYLLVYEFGRKFECGTFCGADEEGTELYSTDDWRAWDTFVEDYLVEDVAQRAGGRNPLYSVSLAGVTAFTARAEDSSERLEMGEISGTELAFLPAVMDLRADSAVVDGADFRHRRIAQRGQIGRADIVFRL